MNNLERTRLLLFNRELKKEAIRKKILNII